MFYLVDGDAVEELEEGAEFEVGYGCVDGAEAVDEGDDFEADLARG